MGDYNLDEFLPIEEESEDVPCPLCEHDVAWLTVHHRALTSNCSKRSFYNTLEKFYDKRMEPLHQQNKKLVDVSRACIERHFETHQLSHTRGLQHDARICLQLQSEIQRRIKRSDGGVDAAALSQWKSLSAYKLGLLKQLSKTNRVEVVRERPYEFS